jgi:hypothetical protein
MLVAALVAVSGCSGRRAERRAETPAPPPAEPPRLGVMTSSESQDAEAFRAAKELADRYPRRVMHITYPDNFPRESVTVIAQLSGLAGEPRINAIMVGQAIPGSVPAARRVRELRPGMRIAFVTPREDPDSIATVCDVAIGPDEVERARTLVAAARDMGAQTLVLYSFPRHLSEPLLVRQRDLMQAECSRRGIRFVAATAPDPLGDGGSSAAREFVTRDVPQRLERLGPATAFYATSDELAESLIRALVDARRGFLVEQALPGPRVGYPGALGLDLPSDLGQVPDSVHAAIRRHVASLGMSGHFGSWSASVEEVTMRAMGSLTLDMLDGKADWHDSATVRRYLEAESRGPVRMRRVRAGAEHWLILLDHVTY